MFFTSEILERISTFFGGSDFLDSLGGLRSYDGWMNEWTLFIADDVWNGHPVSRARGSCIKRSTKGKN